MADVKKPTWRVRRVVADLGDGRELVACADGSWLLASEANSCVATGQTHGGVESAKTAAAEVARDMGWL